MKILHVITSLLPGGAEKLVADLLPRLQAKGHEVELLLLDGTQAPFLDQVRDGGIPVHISAVGVNVYHPRHIFPLRRLLPRFDIVHTHNTAPQFFAAALQPWYRKKVFCTTEHSTSNRRRGKSWCKPIDKWMYARYDAVVCISEQAEHNLRDYLKREDDRICTIYNGVDVRRYAQATASPALRAASREHVLMMAGRLILPKDQDTLIRSMSLLPDDYELWLAGDGPRRGELEQLARQEGVADRVKFLGFRTDMPELLKAADIIVMSSHYEGLSLANLEGMAAGRPFVASDVDGLREVTAGAGILFPHEDAAALAHEVQRLATDRSYYYEIADRCQRRAEEYDISWMVERYDELYRRLKEQKNNRSGR